MGLPTSNLAELEHPGGGTVKPHTCPILGDSQGLGSSTGVGIFTSPCDPHMQPGLRAIQLWLSLLSYGNVMEM